MKTQKDIEKVMEDKELIEKELDFINKFNFNEGKMEKDLLLVNLRELIRKHLEKALLQQSKEIIEVIDKNPNFFINDDAQELFKSSIIGSEEK